MTQAKNTWTRRVVLIALGPALVLATAMTLWGLFEQNWSLIQPLLGLLRGLPAALQTDPRAYRRSIWTFAF
jgi:hypothetical protein